LKPEAHDFNGLILISLALARVRARTDPYPRPWACIAAEHTAGVDVGLNLIGPEKMGLPGGGNATTFSI
jgi:hypothetical protein